ncbi:MAG: zf-HC2 domain-containing protein [Vicinamibacterales bacterium]
MNHILDNHDALLDYLYEEGDPAERLTIAKHLQECAACAVGVLEFQNVRGMLSDWTPPGSQLGFRVVQERNASPSASATSPSASVHQGARGDWWRGWGPATTKEKLTGPRSRALFQAAAAILLFVAGMAASQLTVGYRGGSLAPAMLPGIRNHITLLPETVNPSADTVSISSPDASPVDTERLLQRVRDMIDRSEERQKRELALRLSQVAREVDTQHQADMFKIQEDFGRQQAETVELVRTSGGAK